MPSWAGWETQFLNAAHFPTGVKNQAFLNDWQTHSTSECGNNPIDLSFRLSGSTRCFSLPGTGRYAQKYTSHAQAASAFNQQIHNGSYPALVAAFKSGAPYEVKDTAAVEQQLVRWGSGIFELFYQNQLPAPPPPPQTGPTTDAFKGWKQLRHTINTDMPAALRHSDLMTRRALRSLGRARKVKL